MDMNKAEEYYEKCRAIISVLDGLVLSVEDRETLIWIARDYLDKLGSVIGIENMK